jgi:cell division protein FtsB
MWGMPLVCFLALVLTIAWVGFGDRGLITLHRAELEREAHLKRIRRLAEENQVLIDEIHRLRTDMKYVESVVRNELNLIKENEIVYRFTTTDSKKETKLNSQKDKTKKSAKKGEPNGKRK